MKFPWHKYNELELERRNTLQVFITNRCNLNCSGCFARNMMEDKQHISLEEYRTVLVEFIRKGGKQINLLGGEPFLHPNLKEILKLNEKFKIKTTIYTNGYFLNQLTKKDLCNAKLRVSIYSKNKNKGVENIPKTDLKFDANFMVSAITTVEELLECADYVEKNCDCKTFFISSIRELDNPRQEFFDDTKITMPVIKYKELVHDFLKKYDGNLRIDISKRGVFESAKTLPDTKCRFANYFIGGKIIQCPFDIANQKFQNGYEFNIRPCQHNNTCLMSKIVLEKIT